MNIPIVIPFYKNREQLDKCLEHLRNQTVHVQVYIHDNSDENIYFTRAINAGLRAFLKSAPQEPYIVILNQDMYLEPGAIEEMLKFMEGNPQCGIGMPLQLSQDNHKEVIFAGGVGTYPLGTAAAGPLCVFRKDSQLRWASACCWIMRTSMIREIGLLDENMQLVGSDSDYCFTARARGFQIWNIFKARGIHEGGVSKEKFSKELCVRKILDMDYYARKWITGELFQTLSHPNVESSAEDLKPHIEKIRNQYNRITELRANKKG